MEQFLGNLLCSHYSQSAALLEDADHLAKIESMRAGHYGHAILSTFENSVSADGHKASADESNVRQGIDCSQFAYAVQNEQPTCNATGGRPAAAPDQG